MNNKLLNSPEDFSKTLYRKMKQLHPGVAEMELYEFRYALADLTPAQGWNSVALEDPQVIEQRVNRRDLYDRIQLKPRRDGRIVLDDEIVRLAQMLFTGLVTGAYAPQWIDQHFYFDVRGFFFLHRTTYFTPAIVEHFGGAPYRRFAPHQKRLERQQDVGYRAFKAANRHLDECFIESTLALIAARATPMLVAVAGPTAAGKTEIVERLRAAVQAAGRNVTSIELDNFLTDRDYREQMGINSEGKEALHFELMLHALQDISQGKHICIPRYDFVLATSSHDLEGRLKPGGVPVEIDPADIIFIEGNFPFLLEEVAPLIGIKVVYLTDDPVRLKRKWKRDIDYRKKYDAGYFRNRYFKDQFIMAEIAYRPQLEVCDLAVDTTGGILWATPAIQALLGQKGPGQP